MDNTIDNCFESLSKIYLDLCKEVFEYTGIYAGETNNEIEYRNYLINNPIIFKDPELQNDNPDGESYWDNFINNGGQINVGDIGISDVMLDFICQKETSHRFGYKMPASDLNGYDMHDAGGHKTFGYGLLIHPSGKYMDMVKPRWTQEELENIFKINVRKIVQQVNRWAANNKISLNQYQIDALTSACYNFGIGFLTRQDKVYSKMVNLIKQNPNNPQIPKYWAHLSDAQGNKYSGLVSRRQQEAIWYFKT